MIGSMGGESHGGAAAARFIRFKLNGGIGNGGTRRNLQPVKAKPDNLLPNSLPIIPQFKVAAVGIDIAIRQPLFHIIKAAVNADSNGLGAAACGRRGGW